jgi:hypothetical protein
LALVKPRQLTATSLTERGLHLTEHRADLFRRVRVGIHDEWNAEREGALDNWQ